MKFGTRIRRMFDRLFPPGLALVRLARMQALKISRTEVERFDAVTIPEEGGAYISFRHPDFLQELMIWTPIVPVGTTLRLFHSYQPERRLIRVYGRDDYLA